MIKHIVWDWNGTLLNDMPMVVHVVNQMLARRDMKLISQDDYRSTFGHPVTDFYKLIGFDFALESYDRVTEEFAEGYSSGFPTCQLQQGVLSLLEENLARGISQTILSASHQDVLKTSVASFKLTPFFQELVALDDYYAHSKRERGVVWLSSSGLLPEEILLIGDTTHDYEVARALNCECILVANGHQSRQRLQTCNVRVVDSLQELRSNTFR